MNGQKIVFSEPWKVQTVETNFDLRIENPNEVIVKSICSLVSAGTELACLAGVEGWFPLPGTPGYAAIGEVIEAGSNVSHVKKGQLVYTFGNHAQYFKIDTSSRWNGLCVPVPEGIEPDKAIFARMAGIAMTAIRKSQIELGDDVCVMGLGPIGNLAAQMAQLQGARVIAADISPIRNQMALQSGIKQVLNSAMPDFHDQIKKLTQGRGVSTLIDATGSSAVIEQSLPLVAQYGEVILLGTPRAPYQTDLTKTLQHVHLWHMGSVTLKGALEFIAPTFEEEFVKHSIERNTRILLNLLNDNELIVKPFYTHKAKPSQAAEVYEGLRNKKDEYIGVVFDWA